MPIKETLILIPTVFFAVFALVQLLDLVFAPIRKTGMEQGRVIFKTVMVALSASAAWFLYESFLR